MRAVNVRDYGGVQKAVAAGVKYVGRPSPLGNPFVMTGEGDRATVVAQYRAWLWQRIQASDVRVLETLASLKEGDRVGCWCSPKACHADVVIAAARWLKIQDAKGLRQKQLG